MNEQSPYQQPPVSHLLAIGRPTGTKVDEWLDYPATYGFTVEHIPELSRLALDQSFFAEEYDDNPMGYAPIHAVRVLGQLRDAAAIPALTQLAEQEEDVDWIWEDTPQAFALVGPAAIPALQASLHRARENYMTGPTIINGLEEIAKIYPETKAEIIEIIVEFLREAEDNNPGINGQLVHTLLELKVIEALPVIEHAFATDNVDTMIAGDFEDVQVAFGLKERRPVEQVAPAVTLAKMIREMERIRSWQPRGARPAPTVNPPLPGLRERAAEAKKKAKRKQEKKMRKLNRKRKS